LAVLFGSTEAMAPTLGLRAFFQATLSPAKSIFLEDEVQILGSSLGRGILIIFQTYDLRFRSFFQG